MSRTIAFRYGVLIFGTVLITAAFLWLGLTLAPLYAWLAAVNLIAFLTYGYDKWAAVTSKPRIPEILLLLLAFTGGIIGALLGMMVFRHKTSKPAFKNKLLVLLLLQGLLIAVYYLLVRT